MDRETLPWKHGTVLICTNERPPGGKPSCGRHPGSDLKSWLKTELRERGGPGGECRVLTTSCLDWCPRQGTAVVIQPGDEVLIVDPEKDQEELLRHVQERMAALAAAGDNSDAEPEPESSSEMFGIRRGLKGLLKR